jgi:hypothetical protein
MSISNQIPEQVQSALSTILKSQPNSDVDYRMQDYDLLLTWLDTILVSPARLVLHCEYLEKSLGIRPTITLGILALWPETRSELMRSGSKTLKHTELRRLLLAETALWPLSEDIAIETATHQDSHWATVRRNLISKNKSEVKQIPGSSGKSNVSENTLGINLPPSGIVKKNPILTIRNPVFDTSYLNSPLVVARHSHEEYQLAADAIGDQISPSAAPPALQLECKLPGMLLLQKDGLGFDLVYYPVSDKDIPPRLSQATGLKVANGEWICGPDGLFTWTQQLLSVDGHVVFELAGQLYQIGIS